MFELEIEKIRNGNRKAKPNPTGPKLNSGPAQTSLETQLKSRASPNLPGPAEPDTGPAPLLTRASPAAQAADLFSFSPARGPLLPGPAHTRAAHLTRCLSRAARSPASPARRVVALADRPTPPVGSAFPGRAAQQRAPEISGRTSHNFPSLLPPRDLRPSPLNRPRKPCAPPISQPKP